MNTGRFTVIVIAVAAVAIVAVLVSGGLDLPSLGGGNDDDDAAEQAVAEQAVAEVDDGAHDLPDNPDEVRGTDSYALTRTENFHAAMAVLDDRRQKVEGVFESLRVAPGRIDTIIVHPDDRRTNIQIRPDMEISFESTHDFPTQADYRDGGLTARMVSDVNTSAFLRAIDRARTSGSAKEDVDYLVISRSIIDGSLDENAYMRIRTARPRYFSKEGREVRAIG